VQEILNDAFYCGVAFRDENEQVVIFDEKYFHDLKNNNENNSNMYSNNNNMYANSNYKWKNKILNKKQNLTKNTDENIFDYNNNNKNKNNNNNNNKYIKLLPPNEKNFIDVFLRTQCFSDFLSNLY
jgi:hypothetical protein